jgi:formylmethanofuran dehydrogenase subunit E
MGLAGAEFLGLSVPRDDKGLLIILETDGCFADGVEVATGCMVGHRTLRVEDYGKVAATFVEVATGFAVRLAPRPDVREHARFYAPHEKRRYFAQLQGYQVMPTDELFDVQEVVLSTPIEAIISRPGVRTRCDLCGEEIINEREVIQGEMTLCRGCVGPAYYRIAAPSQPVALSGGPRPRRVRWPHGSWRSLPGPRRLGRLAGHRLPCAGCGGADR